VLLKFILGLENTIYIAMIPAASHSYKINQDRSNPNKRVRLLFRTNGTKRV